ncbi:hypothetical protein Tco_0892770 [Tanacetum coccineum]|uniref:Uncharacterized protein n=1 Tax=Tanacetum coccineum TaxID=301880 RepID=A0ABQ5C9V5_9ASTR
MRSNKSNPCLLVIPGQMTYLVASSTPDSARSYDTTEILEFKTSRDRYGDNGVSDPIGGLVFKEQTLMMKSWDILYDYFQDEYFHKHLTHWFLGMFTSQSVAVMIHNELLTLRRETYQRDLLCAVEVESASGGKKSRESNIGDSDNTGDGGKTAGGGIVTCGGLNGYLLLVMIPSYTESM